MLVALDMDLLGLDERLALALTDWSDIPTNWIRRSCMRARKTCTFFPKPAEIIAAYKTAKEARHKRLKNLETIRDRKRLPPPPMTEAQQDAFWRGMYAMAGMDYDLLKKRREFDKATQHMKRRTP